MQTDDPDGRFVVGARFDTLSEPSVIAATRDSAAVDTALDVGALDAPPALSGPDVPHYPSGPDAPLGKSVAPAALTLRSARRHNRTWLLAFDEVTDRSGAEALRGTSLLSREAAAPTGSDDAPEDGWYEEQLVGLAVERPDGTAVGTVSGLRLGAAQDLLVVDVAGGVTAYLPFVEAIVPVVDVAAGRVVIDPPAGLLELNG